MSQADDTAEYPWDEPEPAQETFNAFGSDDDSDDEMPRTPASRRPRVGGSQGSGSRGGKRKAGSEAPPGAGSTATAVGEGSAGNGGGSSSSRGDSLRASDREAEDGGTEGEREAGREGDDRGKRERDNDDSSSTTTAGTSALPVGDTDLEDDNRAAVRKDTDIDGSDAEEERSTPAPARKEKLGGSSTSGVAEKGGGSSSSKQAQAETAADSPGDEAPPMTPCPLCREEFPTPEVEAHVQRCLDEDDDVQVVDPPGTAAAAQGKGSGARGAGPPHGAAGSGSGSSEGQSAAGNGSGSREGQGASGNGSDADEEKCLVCGKPFPVESLQSHVNLCLDNQIKVEEEREKKESRAKRQSKSVLVSRRYAPTGTRARGPRVKSEDTKADIKLEPSAAAAAAAAPARGDAAVDNGAPPECSPCKPSDGVERKRSGSGSGAGRGGGAAGKRKKGSGSDRPRAQQQKEKVQDKPEGKGKGRLLPPGASGRGFKCPKKPRGCGAINTESSQRCCKCNVHLWTLVKPNGGTGPPVRVRVDDLVRWWELPYMAVPGKDERKQQIGYVYSLEDHNDDGRDMEAFCTYRHQPGYLSAAISLKDLELVLTPPQGERAGSRSTGSGAGGESGGGGGGGGSSDRGGDGGGGGGSSSTGSGSGGGSSVSSLSAGGSRPSVTVQSWGRGKCEHVEAGSEVNYKNGKCHSCHEAGKGGGGSDPMEEEEEKRVEDKSVKCETPGCDSGQYALGVCCACFDRHRERIAAIRTAAKKKRQLQEKNPPPCRACEGLLSETQHAECVRTANGTNCGDENASVDSLDNSDTGRCSECGIIGGKGRDNQLLLCDGNGCPIATHMKCLDPPLNEVPRWLWYCAACVLDKNAELSVRGCNACGSTDDDEKILLCDGPGCNSSE
ncbi:unnamed protein product [Ectocarpus sp. 12 AP-2014]